jgi:hypothetical protein
VNEKKKRKRSDAEFSSFLHNFPATITDEQKIQSAIITVIARFWLDPSTTAFRTGKCFLKKIIIIRRRRKTKNRKMAEWAGNKVDQTRGRNFVLNSPNSCVVVHIMGKSQQPKPHPIK